MRIILCSVALLFFAGACRKSDETSACGASSAERLIACVDSERYHQDLERITGARPPGSPHWQEVQDLCATRLSELGYTVERHTYATGVNVIGTRPGSDLATERVMLSAHYDSTLNCSGADDNASGVAGALEAARVLAKGRYRRTVVIGCWDQEERGPGGSTVGSLAYVARAKERDESYAASFVFEMIGYKSSEPGSQQLPLALSTYFPEPMAKIAQNENRGDFIILIGDPLSHQAIDRFEAHARTLGLETAAFKLNAAHMEDPLLRALRRSDHAPFWASGYPGIMLGDTANYRNPHYHCENGEDAVVDLDDEFAAQTIGATLGAAVDMLELQ
ncbi:aminopeptidase [Myxococcus stipitatus DSM 14675]|uniref:Aminopeptidase n=1 Tax=Myxococcus stipitatus (strain DSM 14675 / JCM 12634 / Mx s8) TaxID=1278073 RepID=L7U1R4_MYXSD|nr:M28 family peptidase [Myxococcus stipitatus]AGC42138.1 aminopeptidase [Myxococcus stipitatus DSM 14675]